MKRMEGENLKAQRCAGGERGWNEEERTQWMRAVQQRDCLLKRLSKLELGDEKD